MDRPPRGGGRPGDHSIAPTEFFKHRSAPDTRSVGQPRPTTPRLQHAVLERRTPRSRSRRPVGQRLPTAAYPRKSGSNSSQRPVIYRPHPHQKHAGLLEFRAPSRPHPRRGQDDLALGHCLGRNAPQRVRPEGGDRSSTKPYISPRGWCQRFGDKRGARPLVPSRSALT